jgi:hypothetical protein
MLQVWQFDQAMVTAEKRVHCFVEGAQFVAERCTCFVALDQFSMAPGRACLFFLLKVLLNGGKIHDSLSFLVGSQNTTPDDNQCML